MRRQNLEHYREFLTRNGHQVADCPEDSDILLVWTCAFRGDVMENSLSALEEYNRTHDAEVVAIGCMPDIAPVITQERFSGRIIPWRQEAEELERIFGPVTTRFHDLWPVLAEPAICEDAAAYRRQSPDADVTFHDQFIKLLICEGCPYECAYCTERLAFPPFRSFPPEQLEEALARVVRETGQTTAILLADCLGEYGRDIGTDLPELIQRLRCIHPRMMFALNNLHPKNSLDYLAEIETLIQSGCVRHLNLPIQSASDHVLARMNRCYTRADMERLFGMLHENRFTEFDTHLIVGFPGETEPDFDETVQFVLDYRLKYVLLSRFLESPNAPAAAFPGKVPAHVVERRVMQAQQCFRDAGIICNWEGSDLGRERLRRLNSHGPAICRTPTICPSDSGDMR